MQLIHIAVVEDEDLYASQLEKYIEKAAAELGVRTEIRRFRDGDEIAEDYSPDHDIIFMDIQMQFMDGMSAAEKIRDLDREVIIIFITNRVDYAVKGYEVDAMDYVLKPVSYYTFSKKFKRAIDRIPPREKLYVKINTRNGVRKTPADQIKYIESQGHNLYFHTRDETLVMREKIKTMEELLPSSLFFKCSRGCLVNLDYVDGMEDGCAVVGSDRLLISRARKNDFLAAMAAYMGDK